jgi:glutathione synthase/RimK-type ligase-like ATP-grasp enzyme
LPSLIFSPGNLLEFSPLRGKVYAGCPIPKLEQLARFRAAGVPVPASVEITPDVVLPEATFGSHVVVKPGHSQASHGKDMTLMRREAVRFQPRETYPEDHPGRYGPMYAQRFVDTGPFVNHYRVITLFGEPLLAFKTSSRVERPPLDAPDDVLASFTVKAARKMGPVKRELFCDPDILELARRTHAALHEIPLQAVDIVKAAGSGELFVLEANPGGNTWIFSKRESAGRLQKALGLERLTDQFDVFATAARVLAARTRAEAE